MGWRLESSQLISGALESTAPIWFSLIGLILLPKHFLLTPLSHYKNEEKKNHYNEQGLVCYVVSCGRDRGHGDLSKQFWVKLSINQTSFVSIVFVYLFFEEW